MNKVIRFGLSAIKGIGLEPAEYIINDRKEYGTYKDLEDFLSRLPSKYANKKTLEALIMSGSLDDYAKRGSLMSSIETLSGYIKAHHNAMDTGQIGLFGDDEESTKLQIKDIPVDKKTMLEWEKNVLGIYVSSHPLEGLDSYFKKHGTPIGTLKKNTKCTIVGMITSVKKLYTKTGSAMCIVSLEDTTGAVEVPIFPNIYSKIDATILIKDAFIKVYGQYEERHGKTGFVPSNVYKAPKPMMNSNTDSDTGAVKEVLVVDNTSTIPISIIPEPLNTTTTDMHIPDYNATLLIGNPSETSVYAYKMAMHYLSDNPHSPDLMHKKADGKPLLVGDDEDDKAITARSIASFCSRTPLHNKHKIVIIENVSDMTIAASNALLKLLEEPPKYVKFICTESNEMRLLDTIRSRLQPYYVPKALINTTLSDDMNTLLNGSTYTERLQKIASITDKTDDDNVRDTVKQQLLNAIEYCRIHQKQHITALVKAYNDIDKNVSVRFILENMVLNT